MRRSRLPNIKLCKPPKSPSSAICERRVDGVYARIEHKARDDQLAAPVLQTLVMSKQIEFFERLIQRATSQGVASFSQRHRDIQDNKISNEAYEKLSYTQKKDYAARFPQWNG